jgi:hypothetical protein
MYCSALSQPDINYLFEDLTETFVLGLVYYGYIKLLFWMLDDFWKSTNDSYYRTGLQNVSKIVE